MRNVLTVGNGYDVLHVEGWNLILLTWIHRSCFYRPFVLGSVIMIIDNVNPFYNDYTRKVDQNKSSRDK
jgi:hypothetical protein